MGISGTHCFSFVFGGFNGSFEDPLLEVGVIKSSTALGTSCVPNYLKLTVKTAGAYLTLLASSLTNIHEGGDV